MHTAPPCPSSTLRAFALGFRALAVLFLIRAWRGDPFVPHGAVRGDSGVARRSGFPVLPGLPGLPSLMGAAWALLRRLAGSAMVPVRRGAMRCAGGRLVRSTHAGGGPRACGRWALWRRSLAGGGALGVVGGALGLHGAR